MGNGPRDKSISSSASLTPNPRAPARVRALARILFAVCAMSLWLAAIADAAVYTNVSYGPAELQDMNVYTAPAPGAPLVVLVHGGGWLTGRDTEQSSRAAELQAEGFSVAAINYRLDAPGLPAFPMEVEDVEAATRFAIGHALDWNADPTRVAYLGGSAGGQLAAMAAVNLDQTVPGMVAKVVTLSGPFNLPDPIEDEEWPQYIGPALGCAYRARGCLTSFGLAAEYSPALQLDPSSCSARWLILNSSEELTRLDQPHRFMAALESEGCSATMRVLAGKAHSFAYWRTVMPEIVEFLR